MDEDSSSHLLSVQKQAEYDLKMKEEALELQGQEVSRLEALKDDLQQQIERLEHQVKEMSQPEPNGDSKSDPKNLELELKKYKIQNENLKLSIQHLTSTYEKQREESNGQQLSISEKEQQLRRQSQFLETIQLAIFKELKRRIQVLKLSSLDKLLGRLGIKSHLKGKFENQDRSTSAGKKEQLPDYMLKLQELFEVPEVLVDILEYKLLEQDKPQLKETKQSSPAEYAKEVVQYIYENLEKPLIVPTDNYINQTLQQLSAMEMQQDEQMNLHSFEDVVGAYQDEDIHYLELEKLLATYFDIDYISANLIVTHLLNKNRNFMCVKRDQVLDSLYPARAGEGTASKVKELNAYFNNLHETTEFERASVDKNLVGKAVNDVPLQLSIDKTAMHRVNSQNYNRFEKSNVQRSRRASYKTPDGDAQMQQMNQLIQQLSQKMHEMQQQTHNDDRRKQQLKKQVILL